MKKFLSLAIFVIICAAIVLPAVGESWDDYRNRETVLFTGNSIPRFIPAPISHIFVCVYDQTKNSWREITTQVDELDGNSGYFGTNYNAVLDTVDEFLFMAGEAGDYAPPSSWIDDEDARRYFRYEFELIDPDNPSNKKYVYVYRSGTFTHDPNLPIYYMKYSPPTSGASDTVKAAGYLEGHNAKGIPDVWRIADSTGNYGPDILDRQKVRVKGKYKYLFVTISFNLSEDNLTVTKFEYKRGPIRVIRDISYKSTVSSIDVTVGTFKYLYYPYRIVALGADKKLDSDYNVSIIRQSFDLNENAKGMLFNNPVNFDVVVDASNDSINRVLQPSPVMNWHSYSGNFGTAVMLNEFVPPSGANYSLYYQESLTGETADGTSDSGDGKSYADAGILFTGSKITGGISLPYYSYFLPGAQPPDAGVKLAHQTQNPLMRITSLLDYTPAAQIAIQLPDTSAPAQYPVSIPILIGNTTGLDIRSCQLSIQFDTTILKATGVSTAKTRLENWATPIVTIKSDTISFNATGTTALQDSGILIFLNFDVIGAAGQQSPLHFVQVKFNTWNPLAIMDDGIFTTLPPPQVAVSIPDTIGITKTKIAIPIRVADVTNLKIISCQIELKYSKVVLNGTAVSLEGTLASGWLIQNLVIDPGYLKFEMTGIVPLQNKGTLAWVSFDVTGSPGSSTTILFKKMQFNNGIPTAVTRNGLFTVYTPIVEQITVMIPDTTIQSGGPLRSPVKISQLSSTEIESYNMTLQFDSTILKYKNVDVTGSLSSLWNSPTVSSKPGEIVIDAKGDIPLSSLGTLLFIDFDVIGPDGSSDTIHFSEMSFNSGTLQATTDDGIVQIQGVIPVELASFTARSDGNQVTLQWRTASETNNFGFHIQRRSGSTPDWQTIGFVPGAGTTIVPHNYSFLDARLDPGIWTYRLQQQDLDGRFNFSQTITVTLTVPVKFTLLQNYPNPFNSSTIIQYDLPMGEHTVNLIIYDLLGHPIRTLIDGENRSAGAHQIIWDGLDERGEAVASGVYFYRLQAGNQILMKKLVLIE